MPLYIGLISGTSMDSVDAVLVSIAGAGFEVVATHDHPIPKGLRHRLESALQESAKARDVWHIDTMAGELFAQAALALISHAGLSSSDVAAIGCHGQTVYHAPQSAWPCTVQLGDPNVIAYRTGITTVADFRRMDLAARGQAAPLAPAFHANVFVDSVKTRGILNIGGIANLTVLPANRSQPVVGFDTGPGNTLMDLWIQRHQGQSHDPDGAWAATEEPLIPLLDRCLVDPYFSAPPPKSTGREHFNLEWLERAMHAHSSSCAEPPDYSRPTVQSTLCQLTVESIARGCENFGREITELFVCGGGARNSELMSRLARRLDGVSVSTTGELGLDPDWVEAVAFAWLAHQRLAGDPGNLPTVTGAEGEVLLGGIYQAQ